MKMLITSYMYDMDLIKCIQTVNKNNTRSKFQSEQTYGLLQGVINRTVRKQAQNDFNG